MPIIRVRLAALAGLASFPEIWAARLTVLTFLHDFGKANLGFQHRNAGGKRPLIASTGKKQLSHRYEALKVATRGPRSLIFEARW
jgi:hypothetical protein